MASPTAVVGAGKNFSASVHENGWSALLILLLELALRMWTVERQAKGALSTNVSSPRSKQPIGTGKRQHRHLPEDYRQASST